MKDIFEFLQEKRSRINLNSDKSYHKGLIELAKWESFDIHFPYLLAEILCTMQSKFHRITSTCESGEAPFASLALTIGEIVALEIGTFDMEDFETWGTKVQLGATIIDTLWRLDYVVLERESRGQYKVRATDKWLSLKDIVLPRMTKFFRGITNKKPRNLTSSINPNGRPIVKKGYSFNFDSLKNSDHIRGHDTISQTGWRINEDILKAVLFHPWDNEVPAIPKEGDKAKVVELYGKLKDGDEEIEKEYNRQSALWETKRAALKKRSNVLERTLTIEQAKSLVDEKELYFYLDADYRSRLYYMEHHIHYQKDDLSKGLLEFSIPERLTARGMAWLLLHAACCYNTKNEEGISVDKLSFRERVNWSLINLEFLQETAESLKIHEEAEKPVMFLAACIDITNAYKAWDKEEDYYSFLPIPVDGSSNAAQHAAAINKDTKTAEQVGMIPSERPIDLYSNIGTTMKELAPEFFAERDMSMGDIRKNLAKRSTMSRQYSAGKKSISKGMFADCHKNKATTEFNITARDCDYMATVAIRAIDAACPANGLLREFLQKLVKFEIGEWNTETEEVDVGNGSKSITWVTPAGFPVECKLNRTYSISERTYVAGKQIKIRGRWDSGIPDIRKHISAIAANYVHSHDSSHMTKVAAKWNGSFGAVHDSFATHASRVDDLIALIKDEFIEMYDHPNYYRFIKDNILSSTEGFDEDIPEVGNLNLEEVRNSDFFFI